MKLAIDCRMVGSGGIGSYISALLPHFLKQYDCLLIGQPAWLESYRNYSHCTMIPCSVPPFSVQETVFFPRNILIQINNCAAYYTPYCNIPSGITVPVFSTIHDVVFLDVPGLSSGIGTKARKWFYQRAVNKSCTIFTVSQFSADRIQYHLKTDKIPVVVTYNALPPWFQTTTGIPDSKDNTILFVGNIKQHKGLHTLLPAFKTVLERGISAKLLIVGNADNFRTGDTTIYQEMKMLPFSTVEFTGKISDSQLQVLYRKAQLLVQPSLYEGFGMPPLEALSLGTNVVLSDIPVFKEIYGNFPVTFFRAGDYNDLADKICAVYNTPAPDSVPEQYSFKKTADIIFNTINAYLGAYT